MKNGKAHARTHIRRATEALAMGPRNIPEAIGELDSALLELDDVLEAEAPPEESDAGCNELVVERLRQLVKEKMEEARDAAFDSLHRETTGSNAEDRTKSKKALGVIHAIEDEVIPLFEGSLPVEPEAELPRDTPRVDLTHVVASDIPPIESGMEPKTDSAIVQEETDKRVKPTPPPIRVVREGVCVKGVVQVHDGPPASSLPPSPLADLSAPPESPPPTPHDICYGKGSPGETQSEDRLVFPNGCEGCKHLRGDTILCGVWGIEAGSRSPEQLRGCQRRLRVRRPSAVMPPMDPLASQPFPPPDEFREGPPAWTGKFLVITAVILVAITVYALARGF